MGERLQSTPNAINIGKHYEETTLNRSHRLQPMLLRMQRCNINLLYKPGRNMVFADTLSSAHLKEDGEEINEEEINA